MKFSKLIFFLTAMLFLSVLGSAGKSAEPIEVTAYSPNGTVLGVLEVGSGNTPFTVEPGDKVCFSVKFKNTGDEQIPAGTYKVQIYVYANGNNVAVFYPLHKVGNFDLNVSKTEELNIGCRTVRDTAPPGTHRLGSRVYDIASNGPFTGFKWFNNGLTVQNDDYLDLRIRYTSAEWDPPEAYTRQYGGYGVDVTYSPSLTRDVTVYNREGSSTFNGEVRCNNGDRFTITDLPEDSSATFSPTWDSSYFPESKAGERVSITCRLYSAGQYFSYAGYWPYLYHPAAGILEIRDIGTDKSTYKPGENGTYFVRVKNRGPAFGSGSELNLKLYANGNEVLNKDIPFTLSEKEGTTISEEFQIPPDSVFVNNMELCTSVEGYSESGNPFQYTEIKRKHGLGEGRSPPYEFCYTITVVEPSMASCEPNSPTGEPPYQICRCSDTYCAFDAPSDLFFIGADYVPYPGRQSEIINNGQRILLKNMNTGSDRDIKLIYAEIAGGTVTSPSMEINLFFILSLLFLSAFFSYRFAESPEP